jgi:hypothetical protein
MNNRDVISTIPMKKKTCREDVNISYVALDSA